MQPPKMKHIRRYLQAITSPRKHGHQPNQKTTEGIVRNASKHVDQPVCVVVAGDLIEVSIVIGQALGEIELRAVISLKPGEYVQAEPAHGHGEAPFARLLGTAFVEAATEMGFMPAVQKVRSQFTDLTGQVSILAIDHAGLNARQMVQAETTHGPPATIKKDIEGNPDPFRSAKEEIRSFEACCCKRKS